MDLHEIPEVRQRAGAVTFRELTAGLVWLHLLRAFTLSLSPKLIALGFVSVLGLFGGGWALNKVWLELFIGETDAPVTPFTALGVFWPTGGPMELSARLKAFADVMSVGEWWWYAVLSAWVLPWVAFGSVTIGRAAALSFGVSMNPSVRGNMRYALARWKSALIAFGVPIVLFGIMYGVLALLGLAFFTSDTMATVGGLGYFVVIIAGIKIAVLTLLIVTGGWMLGAALGVEDTDGVDAIQRAYAYVVNRPINFAFYAAVLIGVLAGGYWLLQEIMRYAIEVGGTVSGAADYVRENAVSGLRIEGGTVVETTPIGVDAIAFWVQMAWLVFIGWVASYVWTGGALLYLAMRRVHDQHDMFDIASERPSTRAVVRPETDTSGGEVN